MAEKVYLFQVCFLLHSTLARELGSWAGSARLVVRSQKLDSTRNKKSRLVSSLSPDRARFQINNSRYLAVKPLARVNKLFHGTKIRQDLMTTILIGIRFKVEAKGEQLESYVDNRLLPKAFSSKSRFVPRRMSERVLKTTHQHEYVSVLCV